MALKLENGQAYPLKGTLKFSEVNVDQGTGAVTLRAVFPNPDGLLMPGMFVQAELHEGVRGGALLVPQKGITRDTSGQAIAMVVDTAGKAEVRKVTTERSIGNQWLVTQGLKAGDRLVVEGTANVQPGATVRPVAVKLD